MFKKFSKKKNNLPMQLILEIIFLISLNLIKTSKDHIWEKFFSQWSKKLLETKKMFLELQVDCLILGMLVDFEVFELTDILEILENKE